MKSIVLLAGLLIGWAAFAQDGGGGSEFDASIPDASVGVGGADNNNQEKGDGTENTSCSNSSDCERGFSCNNNRCHYSGTQVASCQGCGGGAMAALLVPIGLVLRLRRRSQR